MDSVDARAKEVIDWLLGNARQIQSPVDLLAGFCETLAKVDFPVWRATLHIRQLHPNLFTRMMEWRADTGSTELRRPRDVEQTTSFRQSPVARIFNGGLMGRYYLETLPAPREFEVLDELAALGLTDYTVWPLPVVDGTPMAGTLATRRPGGFRDDELRLAEQVMRVLAPLVELLQQRRNAATLLDTYVGHHTGARILAGDIHLGDGETIPAALWFADIRDFTPLSERLPPDELIDALNAFFGVMVGAIEDAQGEVLKFIGDALLAVFRFGSAGLETPQQQAMRAVLRAVEGMDAVNARRKAAGAPEIQFGIGLHVGDVMYGNIGGADRLDFTVVGAAVNLVSRVEKATRSLGVRVLCTSDFVTDNTAAFESLGVHPLRGIGRSVELFAPRLAHPTL